MNEQNSIRVAVVEDEPAFADALETLLHNAEGLAFAGRFASVEAALEAIPALMVPDVVLMDVQLPGKSGIEGTALLKQRKASMEIMMLTTQEQHETVLQALKAGATGYVLKTASLLEIADSIRLLHAGGSPMSQSIARQLVQSFSHAPSTQQHHEQLSDREQDVLHLLAKGFRYKDIGNKLFISPETVKTHIKRIYEKLHVRSRSELLEKLSS